MNHSSRKKSQHIFYAVTHPRGVLFNKDPNLPDKTLKDIKDYTVHYRGPVTPRPHASCIFTTGSLVFVSLFHKSEFLKVLYWTIPFKLCLITQLRATRVQLELERTSPRRTTPSSTGVQSLASRNVNRYQRHIGFLITSPQK